MSEHPRSKRKTQKHHRRALHLAGKRNAVDERVRALRKKAGLTQDNLAAKCALLGWNIDRQIVAHIEGGLREVSDLELCIFCYVFTISPNDLIGWSRV